MSWVHLAITPHSFRQGRALTEVNEGVPTEEVKHSCRWSNSSKVFNAYCCTDLVTLCPDAIFQSYLKSRKMWSAKRLLFISKNLIQGAVLWHPHHTLLEEEFPKQFMDELPDHYPTPEALVCMNTLKQDRENEIYIQEQAREEETCQWRLQRQQMLAAACCKVANAFWYSFFQIQTEVPTAWQGLTLQGTSSTVSSSQTQPMTKMSSLGGDAK